MEFMLAIIKYIWHPQSHINKKVGVVALNPDGAHDFGLPELWHPLPAVLTGHTAS